MADQMKRYYQKEEEFLEEFPSIVNVVTDLLGDDWQPDPDCDYIVRKHRSYFQSRGELHELVFNGASVYHDQEGFSSIQVILKSSQRVVTVLVRNSENGFIAEKIWFLG